jgi:hypothetical protein
VILSNRSQINACASLGGSPLRRRRFQKGSLQQRKHGNRRVWVVLYWDQERKRRYQTLGLCSEMTKSGARQRQAEFMKEVNGGESGVYGPRPVLLGEFVESSYLPFYRGKWKPSTAMTNENRLKHHIIDELGGQQLATFSLSPLQQFLERKADSLSFSVVDHLRWDLRSIFDMAIAEKLVAANPTTALCTPTRAVRTVGEAMSPEQVEQALSVVADREKLILQLAIFAGMRPGELLAIQRKDVSEDGSVVQINRRVYPWATRYTEEGQSSDGSNTTSYRFPSPSVDR